MNAPAKSPAAPPPIIRISKAAFPSISDTVFAAAHRDPLAELAVLDAGHLGSLGKKTRIGHAGKVVGFNEPELALLFDIDHVDPSVGIHAQELEDLQRDLARFLCRLISQLCGTDMSRETCLIFILIIVESRLGDDLRDGKGLIVYDSDGDLSSLDEDSIKKLYGLK